MRILLDYRPALRQRTGVGEYTHELASALDRQMGLGDTLTLFSSSWKDRLSRDTIPGLPIVDARVPVKLLNFAWHRLGWPPVEMLAGAVDVTHSMHPLLMPARRAAQVVTIYDLYFLDNPENTTGEIRRDYPALAAAHARRADVVVTISEYTAGQIRSRFGLTADKVVLCPPGAPAWKAVERHAMGGPLLFMGTIEPRKNVGTLLRAYAQLLARRPDAPALILAGKVSEAGQSTIEELNRPPLAGHARHVGYVDGPERERLFREASMLLMPSLDEGFGMPALEAMTSGVPVIVSNRGAFPELVGDAGILLDPEDAGGIATAMERLLTDESLARQLARAGIERAKRFSWDTSAARLMTAYGEAIERRRSRQ